MLEAGASGKILNSEPNTVLLNIGHQHNRERVVLTEFRNTQHQRAKNECLPLHTIYDEVSALQNYIDANVSPFEAHRRQMARTRCINRPPDPLSMTVFQQQLTNIQYAILKIQELCFFHRQTGMTEEKGIILVFVTPQVKK